ncbi:MAG: SPOR domain-containing protein [Longimicrobiales bacterium]
MKYLAFFAVLLLVLPVTAQQRQLERADSLLTAGQFADARTELADWQRTNPQTARVDPAARSRALYLSARLTTDASRAQEIYLSLVLSYPTARETPDALLRLGQAFLASGEPARAQNYLNRLLADYPAALNRGDGYLWLTRAQAAAGNTHAACATAKRGLANASSYVPEVVAAIQEEERAACSGTALVPPMQPVRALPAARSDTNAPPTISGPAPTSAPRNASSARYALQVGAFREVRSASAIVTELRRKGFDARVTYVEGSALARVRVGRFSTAEAAEAEARKLKNARVSSIVVNDALRERSTR